MSESQRMTSLALANRKRLAMVKIRARVTDGWPVISALDHTDTQPMLLYRLLKAQRGWGVHKVTDVMKELMIGQHRKVGELTARERQRLIDLLEREKRQYRRNLKCQ